MLGVVEREGASAAGGEGGEEGEEDKVAAREEDIVDDAASADSRDRSQTRGLLTPSVIDTPSRAPRERTPRPSAARSHNRDDQSQAQLERTINRSTAAIVELAKAHSTPLESPLTRATACVSAAPSVVALDPRTRMQLIRALSKDGNADLVLGLPDADIEFFVESLLQDIQQAARPPMPQQYDPAFGGGGGMGGGMGGYGTGTYYGQGGGNGRYT
ncbi:hypothetical protein MBLNU457_g0217t1 [Dothideomycetes sp. NU457]